VEGGAGLGGEDGIKIFASRAGSENVAAVVRHAGKDLGDVGDGFAGGEDDLGHAGAQGAVMVELGKAHVFKGEVAEALEGGGDVGAAFADLSEQGFDLGAVHLSSYPFLPMPSMLKATAGP
jgi:hypothetical protein